jgi:hypothetical protein
LSDRGLNSDVLRTDRGNRGSLSQWVNQRETVGVASAFSVGQRIAKDSRYAHLADGFVALYAAGYESVAATCIENVIIRALDRYPKRSALLKHGSVAIDVQHRVVRELLYGLTAAVSIPFALADIDGITDDVIGPNERDSHLKRVTDFSKQASVCAEAWQRYLENRKPGAMSSDSSLPLADQGALAWANLVNRLSLLARRDPALQLHYSLVREKSVDRYQRIVFGVPHFNLT